jgi:hypothetical protein
MSKEDKAFLEKVMKECVIDEVERMKQITALLNGGDPKELFKDAESEVVSRVNGLNTPEQHQVFRQDMLEYLHDLVENLDNAKAFMVVGGFDPVIQIIQDDTKPTSERKECLETLGACAQNNPPCQAGLLGVDVLPILLGILSNDPDAGVRLKALGAISSLCRGHVLLEQKFIANDGVALLVNKLEVDDDIKVKRKSLFFLRALFFSSPESKDQACNSGLKDTLVGLIGHEDIDIRESCLNAIIELIMESKQRTEAFNDGGLQLNSKLETRRGTLKTKTGEDAETAQEELTLCQKLEELLLVSIFETKMSAEVAKPAEPSGGPEFIVPGAAPAPSPALSEEPVLLLK